MLRYTTRLSEWLNPSQCAILSLKARGNFGSIDRDPPAAMRYTEARMETLAEELLQDIDKNTVPMMPNFDGSLSEPDVLLQRFPTSFSMAHPGLQWV